MDGLVGMTGALFNHCELGGTSFNQAESTRQALLFRSRFETLAVDGMEAPRFALTDCEGELVSIKSAKLGALDIGPLKLSKGLLIHDCELPRGRLGAIGGVSDIAVVDCRLGSFGAIGPLHASDMLAFRNCVFAERVEVAAIAGRLDLRGARFPDGVIIRVRGGDIAVDGASFGRPSLITGAQVLPDRQSDISDVRPVVESGALRRPRLLSVRGTDVESLALDDVDLTVCQFAGAHNLDRLRIGSALLFAETPSGFTLSKPRWLARRRMLAEEGRLRLDQDAEGARWPTVHPEEHDWVMAPESLDHGEVAELYRSLRKGREDAKDEPGASDFYYGEMEMRRLDDNAPWGERIILTLYWLLSGYGLRASRAFAPLIALAVLFGILFWKVGFVHPADASVSFWRALTYSAGAATLHPPARVLTTLGEALAVVERVVAPVLLGLALVSIRGRVRR